MIKTRQDIKDYLKEDLKYYYHVKYNKIRRLNSFLVKDYGYQLRKFMILLRKCEYYLNNSYMETHKIQNCINDMIYIIVRRRKNKLQQLLGMEIFENTFGSGLTIYHSSGIVVNKLSRIGKNCMLHGDNCIGNDGFGDECPVIGNNVEIGVGAKIIGNIEIANNIKIGAGAIVISSFEEEGVTIAGMPAKVVKGENKCQK